MALPVFNNAGSTGNGTAITANGTFLTIVVPGLIQPALNPAGLNEGPMLDFCSYFFQTGAGVSGTITFQELGGDGVYRNLISPVPLTLGASQIYNLSFTGPYHGLQIVVSSLAGGTITYGELKACVRSGG